MLKEEIFRKYTHQMIKTVHLLGDGHINDTYIVNTYDKKYVLQHLNGKMDISKLEYNYKLYSVACEEHGWCYPVWIENLEGRYFYTDESGDNWRVYEYIEGDIPGASDIKNCLKECGIGLARMHSILATLSAEPVPVYPMHHDLQFYYDEYLRAVKDDKMCQDNRDRLMEEKIEHGIVKFLSYDKGPLSVIHADPKYDNILFKNGKVIGFIDLDTVMMGSAAEDIADCIRSCCISEGKLDHKAAELLLQGYTSGSEGNLSDMIAETIPAAFNKICFELALRYYTDAISVDKKFKEKYPGYRLKRARELVDLSW